MWSEYFLFPWKKIYWDSLSLCHRVAFAPLLAVSLQCHNDMVSLFFHFVRLSWPFFAPYPKYVTHVLCHTCSLAVLQSCMSSCDRGTKVSWSNTIPRLSNLVSEVSSRYYFAARENVMVSLWFPCDIGFADFGFSKRSLKRIIMCCAIFQAFAFNRIKYRQRSQIYVSMGHT